MCFPIYTISGTPEMLSPSGYDAPTPPPQPSPRAFSPCSQPIQHHQRQPGFTPPQQGFTPPQQQDFRSQQQGFSPKRVNVSYTSPRYDGMRQRIEDGPSWINGYSQYNGDYNMTSSQHQGRPRQSPTIGRKQFVSNGPTYPPSANINYNVEPYNNFDFRNKVPDDDLALLRLVLYKTGQLREGPDKFSAFSTFKHICLHLSAISWYKNFHIS